MFKCIKILMMFCSVYALPILAESKYYGDQLCGYDEFKCVKVQRGDSWAKLFPDKREREIVKRLNRTNMALSSRPWIVVPTNLKAVSYMELSPFPATVASREKLLVVSLHLQAFAAYNAEGVLVHWGPISGGRGWCADINRACHTAIGAFHVIGKEGPECISKVFPIETQGGAPMPYCMYYYKGFALHGSTLPGFHDSHGCIRVFGEDAKWLNQSFVEVGTRVVVTH